jgi:hypothetical protein
MSEFTSRIVRIQRVQARARVELQLAETLQARAVAVSDTRDLLIRARRAATSRPTLRLPKVSP